MDQQKQIKGCSLIHEKSIHSYDFPTERKKAKNGNGKKYILHVLRENPFYIIKFYMPQIDGMMVGLDE